MMVMMSGRKVMKKKMTPTINFKERPATSFPRLTWHHDDNEEDDNADIEDDKDGKDDKEETDALQD